MRSSKFPSSMPITKEQGQQMRVKKKELKWHVQAPREETARSCSAATSPGALSPPIVHPYCGCAAEAPRPSAKRRGVVWIGILLEISLTLP